MTRILARRLQLKMSGYRLAKTVGTTPSHIQRIERGEHVPNVRLGLAIARALEADPGELWAA